jgi:GMP synthase-like glutamine amidotransferase
VLVVEHEQGTGPGWWAGWLSDAGLELDVRTPYDRAAGAAAELPGLEEYAGLLVLGGAMGPTDDDACPWLPATRALMADGVSAELPTFGICLGAELMAVACGGHVRRGPAGPELGVLPIDREPAAADDPLFAALPDRAPVLQWHWEEIDQLPPGAVLLASSPAYRHQAFRLGDAAWGVQGHPEVTPDIAARWARDDSPLIQKAGRRPDDLVAEIRAASDELQAAWRPVADAFATVVQDAFASARGR